MNKKLYTIIFFGIAGSGKGTQVELLKRYLNDNNLAIEEELVYAYPGVEYRKLIDNGGYTGQIVKKTLEQGFLQPDFLSTTFFTNILVSNMTANTSCIADGYPRTVVQSQDFENAMKFYGRENIDIIYIELEKDEAIKRMKTRGRADDSDAGITKRVEEYMQNVIPSMKYFEGKPGYTMHTINGAHSIEQVHADIIKVLGI